MSAREALFGAARILKRKGLAKGTLGSPQGRVCALGAINCHIYGGPVMEEMGFQTETADDRDAVLAMASVIGFSTINLDDACKAVAEWNDRPRRRKHEVVAKLRQAARSLPVMA